LLAGQVGGRTGAWAERDERMDGRAVGPKEALPEMGVEGGGDTALRVSK